MFALEAPDTSLEPLFDNALETKQTAASIREMGVLPSEMVQMRKSRCSAMRAKLAMNFG